MGLIIIPKHHFRHVNIHVFKGSRTCCIFFKQYCKILLNYNSANAEISNENPVIYSGWP
jgi:hypothetical protein